MQPQLEWKYPRCVYSSDAINLLECRILNGLMQHNPDHVKPALDMNFPNNSTKPQRMVGMLAQRLVDPQPLGKS